MNIEHEIKVIEKIGSLLDEAHKESPLAISDVVNIFATLTACAIHDEMEDDPAEFAAGLLEANYFFNEGLLRAHLNAQIPQEIIEKVNGLNA